jgi:hopanoid C-2 methylase
MRRKRILIVNSYADETRMPIRRAKKIPQAMTPVYLAGFFSKDLCEITLYSELASGPLSDAALVGWPDMLVLTGLNTAFDRMLHLTAYTRTANPKVIVVAGGPAVRALPALSSRYFDYVCTGDVEQLSGVIHDSLGPEYVSPEATPRFGLAYWVGPVGYMETSRNCNFNCSFCSLTAEGNEYKKIDLEEIEKEILALGKRRMVLFLDNNFYGNDRSHFLAKLEIVRHHLDAGRFAGWGALVTEDFFLDEGNLIAAREAGCKVLFTGIESFDASWLRNSGKTQNALISQSEMIRNCVENGVILLYGMMFDLYVRPVAALRSELEFILNSPELTLPSYLSLPVPILNTPLFQDAIKKGALLPLTKLRDLDSTTISMMPRDSLDEALGFVRSIQSLRGYRTRVLRHTVGFMRRYGKRLSSEQRIIVLGTAMNLVAPVLLTSQALCQTLVWERRTHVSTTEALDAFYRPALPVASQYASYFRPTMLTDREGALTEDVAELAGR